MRGAHGLLVGLDSRLRPQRLASRRASSVLHDVQAFVLGFHAAHHRLHADRLGLIVGALDPMLGAAATCRSTRAARPR